MNFKKIKWGRFKSIYLSFSVIVVNTGILLALLLAILSLWSPPIFRADFTRQFDLSSYQRVDPETALQAILENQKLQDEKSFEFFPWAVYLTRPFKGRYVNVGSDHSRFTIVPPPLKAGQKNFLIWTFGGSTMFGWAMPDSQTMASHLQTALNSQLPSYRVRVINYGQPFYHSSMELAFYQHLLRTEKKPDVVLFLDGLNDSNNLIKGGDIPWLTDIATVGFERERLRKFGTDADVSWVTINESFPFLRLRTWIQQKFGMENSGTNIKYPKRRGISVADALDKYNTNLQMAQSIGQALGIRTYHFLQPVPWFKGPSTQEKKDKSVWFYEGLIERPRKGFYPTWDLLQDVPFAYVDATHYSDQGNFRVAERVADILVKDWTHARP